MHQRSQHVSAGGMSARTKWVLTAFIAIALFFLLTEHRAHLFGVLPYLLLFACPLMHLFHGHGHHGHQPGGQDQRPESSGTAAPGGGRTP